MDRRAFIKNTGLLSAGTLLVPSFLRAGAFSAGPVIRNKRVVIIQLSGGNDGLNTIIPHGMDPYYQQRTKIGLKANELLKIDDQFGFHPALKGLHTMHKEGILSIINSVGYPNPNRSHFRSMDIWHSASGSKEIIKTGWLGRYLDSNCKHAHEALEIEGVLSLAL